MSQIKSERQLLHYMLAAFDEFDLFLTNTQKRFRELLISGRVLDNYLKLISGSNFGLDPLDTIIRKYFSNTLTVSDIRTSMQEKNIIVLNSIPLGGRIEGHRQNYFFNSTVIKKIDDEIYTDYPVNPQWITPSSRGLAKEIYDSLGQGQEIYALFGILGDYLEESGCNDGFLIEHCRSEIYHCRGCWLIEALLEDI